MPLQRVLRDETAPVNERLKPLFGQFRIEFVDDDIVILPVLLPDVIESRADPSGLIKVVGPDGPASSCRPMATTPRPLR